MTPSPAHVPSSWLSTIATLYPTIIIWSLVVVGCGLILIKLSPSSSFIRRKLYASIVSFFPSGSYAVTAKASGPSKSSEEGVNSVSVVIMDYHGGAPEVVYIAETGESSASSVGLTVPGMVGGEWNIVSALGHGSFGQVFLARNAFNPDNVIAVKMELKKPGKSKNYVPYIVNEAEILNSLQGRWGFPQLIGTWKIDHEWYGLGMSVLGPSLAELTRWLGGTGLDWPSIVAIGSQVLFRLQTLHSLGFLHRDIKPHNLLMGLCPSSTTVYLVDYGLSKSYLTVKKNKTRHIPQKKKHGVVGTVKFASIFLHEGSESSMRDDLESLAYSLIWLGTGRLPWDSVDTYPVMLDKETRSNIIHTYKLNTSILKTCEGVPLCVGSLLAYARDMDYGEVPDYDYLQSCFYSYSMNRFGCPPHALSLHWHD